MAFARLVAREAVVYLSGFAGVSLLQFLAMPVYTRDLGPDAYAGYSVALAVTTVFAGIAAVGGDVALSRYWFRAPSLLARRDLTLSLILVLTLWSIAVVLFGAVAAVRLGTRLGEAEELGSYIALGLISIVPAQLSRMLAQVLRNEFRPVAFSATTLLTGVLAVGLGLYLCVARGMGVPGVLIGTILGESAACAIRFLMVARDLKGRWRPSTLRAPLRFGVPFVPAALASWVFAGADRIAVGWYLPPGELGGYAVATMVVAPFSILVSSLGQAWIPRITDVFERSPEGARHVAGRAFEVSVVANGAAATVAGAAAPLVLALVAGPGYESGEQALPLLAVGAMFLGISLFAGTGYTLAKRTSMVAAITGGAAALSALLLLLLTPRLGVVGASSAVAIGYATLAMGSIAYSQRCLRVPINWLRTSSALAAVITSALVSSAWPGSPTALAVGATALAALGVMSFRLARPGGRIEQAIPNGDSDGVSDPVHD